MFENGGERRVSEDSAKHLPDWKFHLKWKLAVGDAQVVARDLDCPATDDTGYEKGHRGALQGDDGSLHFEFTLTPVPRRPR